VIGERTLKNSTRTMDVGPHTDKESRDEAMAGSTCVGNGGARVVCGCADLVRRGTGGTGWWARVSLLPRVSLAVLLAGGCLTAVVASAATTPGRSATASPAPRQPIIVNAALSRVDYQTGTATFKNILLVQGDTRLTAERAQATGLSFESSTWTFDGNVLIVQQRGTLRSDRAVVEIHDNQITVATITGHPALFEQQRAQSRGEVHGHADTIVQNASQDTARLSGDAWLSDGSNEVSAPLIVYNFRDETMQALSHDGSRRVHITLPQGIAKAQISPPGATPSTAPGER
jgi:lipopolysaccharide transport protein LptA